MRQVVYRIMRDNGDFPRRSWGIYTDIFYDVEYAKRCLKAIKQFNKGGALIIEESEVQWVPHV